MTAWCFWPDPGAGGWYYPTAGLIVPRRQQIIVDRLGAQCRGAGADALPIGLECRAFFDRAEAQAKTDLEQETIKDLGITWLPLPASRGSVTSFPGRQCGGTGPGRD